LGFLHRVQKGLSAGQEKSVEAGADQQKREVLDAIGSKSGTDGAGEKIKSGKFGEDPDQGNDEAATVADRGEQVAPQDGVELVESGRHKNFVILQSGNLVIGRALRFQIAKLPDYQVTKSSYCTLRSS